MLYTLIGFFFGFSIPYIARRFAKIMQQTPTLAYAIYRLLHINKQVSKQKRLQNHKYIQLRNRYFMRSLGWGIVSAAVVSLTTVVFQKPELPWLTFFIIILLILTEIDKRIEYLPDILTSPLLISGFLYASFTGGILGEDIIEKVQNSSLGAAFGYLIPVIASIIMIKKHPDNMGGGDIKILAAIGAWLGLTNIPFVILLSCLIFAINCFVNKQRAGAFGPSIVLSAIIMLFFTTL